MIRKRKFYQKPRQMFESERIEEENVLVKKYGLKNKGEIWKTLAKVNYFRGRAKALAKKPLEEQEVLLNKLRALGLNVSTTADVLGLQIEDILKRRLPTVVAGKKLANTVKEARQLVTHKRVLLEGQVIDAPSYLVPVKSESAIKIKEKNKKSPKQNKEPKENKTEKTEEENQ